MRISGLEILSQSSIDERLTLNKVPMDIDRPVSQIFLSRYLGNFLQSRRRKMIPHCGFQRFSRTYADLLLLLRPRGSFQHPRSPNLGSHHSGTYFNRAGRSVGPS